VYRRRKSYLYITIVLKRRRPQPDFSVSCCGAKPEIRGEKKDKIIHCI